MLLYPHSPGLDPRATLGYFVLLGKGVFIGRFEKIIETTSLQFFFTSFAPLADEDADTNQPGAEHDQYTGIGGRS